jgi:hypothetical protein
MRFLFQRTGIIDQYKEHHLGTQPIRVLNNMNLYMFMNTHPGFNGELITAIEKHGLAKKIDIKYGESKIERTPYIDNDSKAITLDETFLSYLWCVCHTIYMIYLQTVNFPRVNKIAGFDKYHISSELLSKAYELFDYAKSLIIFFDKWDIDNMPNPERYLAENRDYIEQPNMFYAEAIKFILCHEYVHAIRHIDKIKSTNYEHSHYIEFEREADYEAIELMKRGMSAESSVHPVSIGVTLGILSMFFFKATTKALRHPNTEDRLVQALVQLDLDDDSPCWGLALVGLKLWSEQFGLSLHWNPLVPDKEAFYEVIGQIKVTANS